MLFTYIFEDDAAKAMCHKDNGTFFRLQDFKYEPIWEM